MAKAVAKKRTRAAANPVGAMGLVADKPEDREHITVEKIDNGFIINRSGVKDGKYFDRKQFSETKPVITIAGKKQERR